MVIILNLVQKRSDQSKHPRTPTGVELDTRLRMLIGRKDLGSRRVQRIRSAVKSNFERIPTSAIEVN
jgi:hypothetical protein